MAKQINTDYRAKRAPASSNATGPKPASESRRELFKALGVGAAIAIPARWARPVVEAVVLPAHAVTSPDEDTPELDPPSCASSITSISVQQDAGCTLNGTQYYRLEIDDSQSPTGPYPLCIEGPVSNPGDPTTPPGDFIRIIVTQNSNPAVGVGIRVEGENATNGLGNTCNASVSDTVAGAAQTGGVPNGTTRTFSFDFVRDNAGSIASITINNFSVS